MSQHHPEDIPFVPIGQNWVTWSTHRGSWESQSLAFSVSNMEGRLSWGGGAGMDKDWLEKATNHDVTSLKFHVEAFFSGYAKIWKSRKPNCFCKDSQGKTILDGARDQDQRWYHLMMSYFRAGLQIRNEDLKQSCSEWEDTTLTIFRRPQRLAAKFRPEAEVGFLELADPWTFGECSLCREQCIEHCGGGGIWRYQMYILTSRKI